VNRIVFRGRDTRGQAVHSVVKRLSELAPGQAPAADPGSALAQLRATGCVADVDGAATYSPSFSTRQAVFAEPTSAAWNEKVVKKQKAAFRSSAGAVFRLPLEGRDKVVEAFITDWSPFPGAAAVAVHPGHPLAPPDGVPRFTGTFARHPLHGDLLPVWVAPWVRPDFGTGAVIVNPAHSDVDLQFARHVGLPVRFALAATPPTSNPTTWPVPPVVKTGAVVRAGAFDGLPADQAVEPIFAELAANGWAERVTDRSVGVTPLATPDGTSEPVLEAVLAVPPGSPFELFWPVAEADTSLLFARMLYRDLVGRPLEPTAVRLWQRVEGQTDENPDVMLLAALAAGPLDQVGVVKSQTLDQVRYFFKTHAELTVAELGQANTSSLGEAQRDLCLAEYHKAFATLYRLQKQAAKDLHGLPAEYFTLVYALTGLPVPSGIRAEETWESMVGGPSVLGAS
jgi:leucyl-tRNA synthetase